MSAEEYVDEEDMREEDIQEENDEEEEAGSQEGAEEDEVVECPEELGELGDLCNERIPNTMMELETNVDKIQQIHDFCSKKYFAAASGPDSSPEKLSAAYEETKKYLSSAMLNVAWSIQSLTTDFSDFITLQEDALDALSLSLDALNTRLHSQYLHKGAGPLRQAEGRRGYVVRPCTRKLEGAELPELAKPFAPEEEEATA